VASRQQKSGLAAAEMLQQPLKAYMLVGGVEPWADTLDPESTRVSIEGRSLSWR